MEENKTTRVNRTVNYYSDRPMYDHYPERPKYDHCPERPEYDYYPERPKYDHRPVKPEYDHCPERPMYDHYPERPKHDHYPERPKHDYHDERPKHDHYPERPDHDCHDERPKHDCHDEKHEHDCRDEKCKSNCSCCPEKTTLTSNGCTKCCNPMDIHCPDIHCAVCTPILADKIHAFACTKQSISQSNPALFTINNPPTGGFPVGSRVCINKIAVRFTCAGITTDPLPINICSFTGSLPPRTSPSCSASLFNSYEGTITSNFLCHDKGTCATFAHNDLDVTLIGAQYVVEGFIGSVPFTASTVVFGPRIYNDINLFGNICLPKSKDELTLRANFEFKFTAKQITPSAAGILAGGTTFDATILDILSISEKLFSIKQEELVVYSSPDGFKRREE